MSPFSRTVDELLPKTILDALQNALNMLGLITVTAVVNPYFLIPILLLSILFQFIQKIYLKTSKNVKRLEGISKYIVVQIVFREMEVFFHIIFNIAAKSPGFTHLAATLSGMSTVRAYNAEAILKREFDTLQDTHTACYYITIATRTVFGFSLDIVCFLYVCCIIFYYMLIDTEASGEKVGLAITQALGLTGVVQWG